MNSKIKVIELVPTLTTGGAEAMIRDYCLLFNKDKIDARVVVIDRKLGTYNEKALEDSGIKVTYLSELLYGSNYNLNVLQRVIRRISRYIYWRNLVIKEQPDIIHMHLHLDRYMQVLPLHRLKCKLVMTIHNVIDNYFSKDKSDGDKYREYREVNRLIHKNDLKLIAIQDVLGEELKSYFNTDNVVTVNNGVILDRFDSRLCDRTNTRLSLGVGEEEFLIGHVGSMMPQKNHDLILEIFCELANRYPHTKLLLIGQGNLKDSIISRIEESGLSGRVIVLSNRDDIPQLMAAMDVFLFPSRWEGFGNVLIEAQSIGLKCVVSDAVQECTRVSDKVVVCKLSDAVDTWIKALMTDEIPASNKIADIDDYNMINCVRKLEDVYEETCYDR